MTTLPEGSHLQFRGSGADDRPFWAPTSRPSDDVANGRVARELPIASALLIRLELAHKPPFVTFRNPKRDWTFDSPSCNSASYISVARAS